MGNQTQAYPFGWRNDRWLQNVLPVKKNIIENAATLGNSDLLLR